MNTITEVTRRAIIDYLSLGISWSGRLISFEVSKGEAVFAIQADEKKVFALPGR
jgi:hypothetical protein